jgi:Rrf2 family protein
VKRRVSTPEVRGSSVAANTFPQSDKLFAGKIYQSLDVYLFVTIIVTNMNTNQRFAISIHALTLLASSNAPLTSEMIASSVDTNPVVIRRAMANLRVHGLVKSKPGAHGGWTLVREPARIGLSEVYQCLGEDDVLFIHSHPNKDCPIGGKIKGVLQNVFGEAQAELEKALGNHTVADVLEDVRAQTR